MFHLLTGIRFLSFKTPRGAYQASISAHTGTYCSMGDVTGSRKWPRSSF